MNHAGPTYIFWMSLLIVTTAALKTSTDGECFTQSADIVFAVDSSFSIRSDDFQRQLTFLRALIDTFTIGENHMQVGVVSFGSTVRPNIYLNDFSNSRDLKKAVMQIEHSEGGTVTHEALKFIHSQMYLPEHGGRPWAKRQLVLITDGLSINSSATLLEASIARVKNIEIFSIGVGEGVEDLEIRGVASEPRDQHVFRVENYKALAGIENALSSAACEKPVGDQSAPVDVGENVQDSVFSKCSKYAAEIFFMMDCSSSIWEIDFQRQVKFIQKVISNLHIGADTVRVGVLAYSNAPITLVALDDEQTYKNIHTVLDRAPYIIGGTNTALAIQQVRTLGFSSKVTRPHAAKILVVLTDGQSDNLKETMEEASRAHQEGIQIFSVGIGKDARAEELISLASKPADRFVFHVNDFEALPEIQDLVAVKACEVAESTALNNVFAKCPGSPKDVVFIYDTNALTPHHQNYVIRVITQVTESNVLNSEDLRVGVVREAVKDNGVVGLQDIELTDQWTQSNFKDQLDPELHRRASIDLLLRKVRHKYFYPTFEVSDAKHKRLVVIFLDSSLEKGFAATIEAIRLRRSQVAIVVVTLGKHYDHKHVLSIASAPHTKYIVNAPVVHTDYHLQKTVSQLLAILCE